MGALHDNRCTSFSGSSVYINKQQKAFEKCTLVTVTVSNMLFSGKMSAMATNRPGPAQWSGQLDDEGSLNSRLLQHDKTHQQLKESLSLDWSTGE